MNTSIADLIANLPPPTTTRRTGVAYSNEFSRVSALPRRQWTDEEADELAAALTEALKKPGGEMSLRPVQAIALQELFYCRGLFVPLRVGGGKTLITLLAPTVLQSKRTLLLIPAKLKAKTEREMLELARHWNISINHIRIVSYELLGRVQSATLLDDYKPDLIVCDEAHKLKNDRAAVTRRVARYLANNPTRMLALSGTVTKRSLKDYGRIIGWCLGDKSPLPNRWTDLEQWAQALDEKVNPVTRMAPGALLDFCNEEERELADKTQAARLGYQRRFIETPGVVTTRESRLGCSLQIDAHEIRCNSSDAEEAFKTLRVEWMTPDEWPIADAIAIWRHARELALGFFYRWNPRPPKPWLDARKNWASLCRHIITTNRSGLDSELQVARAVSKQGYGAHLDAPNIYREWKDIEPVFEPNTEAVWFDDAAVECCIDWARRNTGIVWVEQKAFGARLSELSGLPLYANQGLNQQREPIESADGKSTIIATLASNSEGRNLQQFCRNLIASPPPNGSQWEQLLGRTHRDGQQADEVTFDVLTNCIEHGSAVHQAIADCRYMQQTTGSEYKLCYADLDILSLDDLARRQGYRWVR